MQNQQRKLDDESLHIIKELQQIPDSKKTFLTEICFDVAITFGKRTEYRMLYFNFKLRKLFFLRHAKVREEILFSSLSQVGLDDKIKIIWNDLFGNATTHYIITQSYSDTVQIFYLLRTLSFHPLSKFFEEDFKHDIVKKKYSVKCKKRGQTAWAHRQMIIYNGEFILFGDNPHIPLTICPLASKVSFTIHANYILEINTAIRKIILSFSNDHELNMTYNTLMTCEQFIRPPVIIKVRTFTSNKLAYLLNSCRDICIKNMLYPDECVEHFAVLCEILRAITKKRSVTQGNKKEIMIEEDEYLKKPQIGKKIIYPEDELKQYCLTDDPKKYYKNFVSVGKGGFGDVYKVQRIDEQGYVALKVLKHSVEERSEKMGIEVARMKLWDHPNLIKMIGCWLFGNQVFISMEYCSLGTLKTIIKNQPMPLQDIAYVIQCTLKGLEYIHKQGFIHRDIKTTNIMLDGNYNVKIIDFGLVVRINSNPSNRAGSKSYMAPEVIKQIPYNEKVDVWSIGCVAQELFETQPPYKEHGVIKGMFKTAVYGAEGLRDITKAPVDFVDFINKCFVFESKDRASCTELLTCCGKDTTQGQEPTALDVVDADTISSNTFNESSIDYIFKFIIIGEFSVGKTCLLMRFQDGTFREEYESTIGVEFGTKNVQIQDTIIKLRIWDTAGSEKFRCITRGYFRGSVGAIIVYDISNRNTFEHIDEWVQELEKYNPGNHVLMIIGNKCDSSQRTVTTDEGKNKAKELNAEFFECSAKTGENIEKAFITLTELVLRDVSSGKISLENN
ncbi:hypothetical protein ENUP19_0040G0021 [Entamoeba nuttalli]|uniref:Protein kinase, putative n=2 Tax=Entamoeba nuttalli TaxID=412467 RepID=K2H420_ENTNP|nr:protein kinase, putative [Entamoeba nuttalli P19]EKE37169.1 protein kinase, putative [Entamoeba nuttalli P19]|eukprot:XP_008860497.1 protein kinase, putative [Entamoeba nuttalli P19]